MAQNSALFGIYTSKIQTQQKNLWLQGFNGSALSFFIQSLHATTKKSILFISERIGQRLSDTRKRGQTRAFISVVCRQSR